MGIFWTSYDQIVNKSWRSIPEQAMNKLWKIVEQVVNKLRISHEEVVRKWTTMNKSSTSHEQIESKS